MPAELKRWVQGLAASASLHAAGHTPPHILAQYQAWLGAAGVEFDTNAIRPQRDISHYARLVIDLFEHKGMTDPLGWIIGLERIEWAERCLPLHIIKHDVLKLADHVQT